jgi:2-oxoisovalerate dehydrogenase E1 component alpha subunit
MIEPDLLEQGRQVQGRQLPIMYSDKAYGFFSISGNWHAISAGGRLGDGAAIKGDSRIAWAGSATGATAEGDFHSAMTFAAVYIVPSSSRRWNNQWASRAFRASPAPERATFASAPSAMGSRGFGSTAMTRWRFTLPFVGPRTERARRTGPDLIEFFTYRAEGHSTSDDPSGYRRRTRQAVAARRSRSNG